ncbi:MAG: AAA family ATPase [Candidatus Thiodiazotropha sp. (ex Dulcina madagascariensis)]|nr:AAA family ATPase [Candidatus Thiodiazotropha sp. (ex Dulcina madagascariensis)]
MFESYYALNANPFRLSADEQFRFAHKNYLKAWSYLRYALEQGEGFVMVTGRPGSGKTTLVRDILSDIDESKILAINLVTNQLQAEELLRKAALEYGLPAETYNKATLLTRIEAFVTKQFQAGRRAIIVIDEAQNLTLNGLEELRLLSNLQTGSHPLFQIFLVGQEQLRNLILGPAMEQIRQRLIASCQIDPMTVQQTEGYIEHRLGIVGWQDDPRFDPTVFPLIYYLTNGIPRKINHVASRLLLYGALEKKHGFTDDDVWIVAKELFDEERLSLKPGESFETFKSDYESIKERLLQAIDEEAPEADDQADLSVAEHAVDSATYRSESETADDSETYLTEEELEALASRILQQNRSVADELMVEAVTTPIQKEAVPDVGAEGLRQNGFGDIGDSDLTARKADDILNLPSMQAEKRKHDIEEKGGLINTAETVEVDELFSENLRKSLRRVFFLVAGGLLILVLFIFKPEQIRTAWVEFTSKFQIVTNPQSDQPQEAGDHIQSRTGEEVAAGSEIDQRSVEEAKQTADQTAAKEQPGQATVSEIEKGAIENPPSSSDSDSQIATADDASPLQEIAQPSQESTPPQEAGQDYIATQSRYQQVELEASSVDLGLDGDAGRRFQIYFEIDKTEIPQEFDNMLNDLYIVLSLNKQAALTISGYTDVASDPIHDMRLSLKRAQAVSRYFTERGISKERIQVEGRRPIPGESDVEQDSFNKRFGSRRVELILRNSAE